jgi:hypothetical protein
MIVKPISPNELKRKPMPEFVITAFNELLADKYNGRGDIIILQKNAVAKIIEVSARGDYRCMVSEEAIFKNGWLDIEDEYRAAGWLVAFDKPGYCESYEASWVFKKKQEARPDSYYF